MRCLLRFGGGRGGGVDGGVEVDGGDTTVGGKVDAVVGDAGRLRLMFCRDLYFRPTRLLFLFIGIVTIFLYISSISAVFEYEILYLSLLSLYIR